MAREYIEATKLLYDVLKHLTTLSTGSIVVMATFLEKFFKSPAWTFLVPATFIAFVVSIVACVAAMAALAFSAETDNPPPELDAIFNWGLLLGTVFFLAGVVALAIFSVRNF